jgi:hypothetical protein
MTSKRIPIDVPEVAGNGLLDRRALLGRGIAQDADVLVDGTTYGAILLLTWATDGTPTGKLRRSDLEKLPKTSFAKMLKDSTDERAKTICAAGRIIQIARDHSEVWGGTPVWVGLMSEPNGDLTRYYAVGSSGELVEGSVAAFCGVSVGRFDYANSAGGTGHAVAAVGIFLF